MRWISLPHNRCWLAVERERLELGLWNNWLTNETWTFCNRSTILSKERHFFLLQYLRFEDLLVLVHVWSLNEHIKDVWSTYSSGFTGRAIKRLHEKVIRKRCLCWNPTNQHFIRCQSFLLDDFSVLLVLQMMHHHLRTIFVSGQI